MSPASSYAASRARTTRTTSCSRSPSIVGELTSACARPTRGPILEGADECIGTVNPITGALTTQGCNPYIDVAAIATEGHMRDSATLKSADKSSNTTATNANSRHYAWYVEASGLVRSVPAFLANTYP